MDINKQIEDFAHQMESDQVLQSLGSANLLGFSQGTMVTRGYIQRFNSIKTHNWISMAGPQAGQFGLSILPEWIQNWVDGSLRESNTSLSSFFLSHFSLSM